MFGRLLLCDYRTYLWYSWIYMASQEFMCFPITICKFLLEVRTHVYNSKCVKHKPTFGCWYWYTWYARYVLCWSFSSLSFIRNVSSVTYELVCDSLFSICSFFRCQYFEYVVGGPGLYLLCWCWKSFDAPHESPIIVDGWTCFDFISLCFYFQYQ